MPLTIDLSGQVALVTGASSGIGLSIAKILAKAGASIAACALEISTEWEVLERELRSKGQIVRFQSVDVKDSQAVRRFVRETADSFGALDIVVSNAGANMFIGAENCDSAQWDHNMELNLKSHWVISQASKPHLDRSSNGVIIVIGSNHGIAAMAGCFPYNVAKTALIGLVRSLAIEWGPYIRTVGIAPGFIETPAAAAWFASFTDAEAKRHSIINNIPVGKLGTPEEIGAFCAFLASSYASFASGSTYVVDGGRTALLQED